MSFPLIPAELAFAGDGTPFSPRYGDIYHSSQGGLAQARHVFLAGNQLPARWTDCERFVILETGFGLGLNFLATCRPGVPLPALAGACITLRSRSIPSASMRRPWPRNSMRNGRSPCPACIAWISAM
jgi:hypothetical protein